MTLERDNQVLLKLNEWEGKEECFSSSLRLYRDLLSIAAGARLKLGIPFIKADREAIDLRLREGRPLLDFEYLAIDWVLFRDLFNQVVVVMKRFPEFYDWLPEDLSDACDLKSMAKEWYCGDQLEKYECKENDLPLILHAALRPFLSVCSEALLKLVDEDLWRRGYCPICGGSPDLAFLDKESGARHLVCNRCDAEWRFQRMECPHCGNQDQNTLAYFTGDSARYRLYVCENCRNYLKAIDLRCGEDQFLIPLERFLTFDLDVQACEKGYIQQTNHRAPYASCNLS